MSILNQMKNKQKFSTTEQQILQYLEQNPDSLETMTIQTLAEKTYSSNATIIRMCHKLHFSGFREFKIAFIKELENQKLVTKTIDYSYPFQLNEPASDIVQNMFSLFKECMDLVQTRLDVSVLEQMVQVMEASNRTFFFGIGDTKLTIRSFINKGAKINFFPILATDNDEGPYICKQMDMKDCAMFITYSGKHKTFIDCASYLRNKGVKVLVLTSNPDSYIAKNCDLCICIPDLEKEVKIATFYSQLVFQYILNLMYSLLYRDYSLKIQSTK